MGRVTLEAALRSIVCGALWLHADPGRAQGPGLGNFQYGESELFQSVSTLVGPLGYGRPAMVDGYLMVVYSSDGGGLPSDGGLDFWDVSNPRAPRLAFRHDTPETHRLREAQGFSFAKLPGDRVGWATHSEDGIQIWDLTDASEPQLLSDLVLPGIALSPYGGTWWVFWQAPYLYAAGVDAGLYVIDTSDPGNPQLLRRMPTGQLSGLNPAVVYALGNMLILSEPRGRRAVSLDISDPASPAFLHTLDVFAGYSHTVAAGKLLISGGEGDPVDLFMYRIERDGMFVYEGNVPSQLTNGGYGSYQDGYFLSGFSAGVAKFQLDPLRLVGVGSSNLPKRDEDFGEVFGNLVLAADDHGSGSALIVHQTAPDKSPPRVDWLSPAPNATGIGLRSPVSLSMSDQIDVDSLGPDTLYVVGPGGRAHPGTYSVTQGIVAFTPSEPWLPNTRYRITLADLRDWSGNAAESFSSDFTTSSGQQGNPLDCAIAPLKPVRLGEVAHMEYAGNPSGLEFAWDFGDGSAPTSVSSAPQSVHTYREGSRFPVLLSVSDSRGIRRCSAVQVVYAPLTSIAPRSSSPIVYDAGRVYIANQDGATVTALDAASLRVLWEAETGDQPTSLAVSPDGELWVVDSGAATLSVLSLLGKQLQVHALPFASRPHGIVFGADGLAYVTLEALGELAVVGRDGSLRARIEVGPRPRGIAVDGAGRRALITRFVSPAGRGELYEVDLLTREQRVVPLAFDLGPDTEGSGRGVPNYLAQVVISPDGHTAVVPSKKDNVARGLFLDGQEVTFESRVRAIVSRVALDPTVEDLALRIDFNDHDMPQAAVFSPLGDLVCVAFQGSDTVEIVDRRSGAPVSRLATGHAPRGLVFSPDGARLFVHNFLSRSVSVFDTSQLVAGTANAAPMIAEVGTVASEPLAPEVLLGKRIFYNAADLRMSRDGYLSCASCHLDGDQDGQVWDVTQIGEGLRNTISLLGRAGTGHGNLHWTANFDEVQDFEHDIRGMFGGRGFLSENEFSTASTPTGARKAGLNAELDALAAYVSSLDTFPASPHRGRNGRLTAAGSRGRLLFARAGCARCHGGDDFTDKLRHDVGTIGPGSGLGHGEPLEGQGFETPTLRGVWDTAPYFHDGSGATLGEAISRHAASAVTLRGADLEDLVAYVQQIDGLEPRVPAPPLLSGWLQWVLSWLRSWS